ncbi:DUF4168 domain-containing protein [Brumimicrobium mesophilum]|uniref:DUF4168 domain-containing protein n=1 Tax=Brumimicrobium mesophilum TaxID=392717 RepID=UPI000D14435A|nr:DUF4168 domain-containing protein [Brumimicrobium mesophilum]
MKITTLLLAFALTTGATSIIGQEQMLPAQENQTQDITDKELKKFANVYVEVQSESQKMQEKAVKTIEEEGMEIARFNEIAKAQNDPNKKADPKEEEVEKLAAINSKMSKIQSDFQAEITKLIQQEGLTLQRYQELYTAIQKDEELQQKFGTLISG